MFQRKRTTLPRIRLWVKPHTLLQNLLLSDTNFAPIGIPNSYLEAKKQEGWDCGSRKWT